MQAFVLDAYKKAAPLRLAEMPDPVLGDGDVLVRIHAAALNMLDSKIRDGAFKQFLRYTMPRILGHDLAGTVVQIGARVSGFKLGDAVYARPRDGRIGSLAELIAVDQADLALKPRNLTMAEAASLPLVGLTAWQVLVDMAALQPGQKVLIHAGSGGVGTIAIQLAKHLGTQVAATTSTANLDLVRSLGADVVVDYRKQSFETILSGYDVVLCSLDGDTLAKSLQVLKPGGKLISISGPPTAEFARAQGMGWGLHQILRLLSLGIRRKAARHGASYDFLFMRADGAQLAQLTALIESGAIRPLIDRNYPFDQTNEALTYLETGRAKGKVVISLIPDAPAQ